MTTRTSGPPGGGAGPSAPGPAGQPSHQVNNSSGTAGRLTQLAWASVPVWSFSLLAFAPFLRIALARRRMRDWAVFAGYLAAIVTTMILLSVGGPDDSVIGAAVTMIIVVAGVAAVHAFVAFQPKAIATGTPGASKQAVAAARARMRRRQQARQLYKSNPALGRELGIGRPDVPHDYDDGGLVDVNHVPGHVLASCLGLTAAETAAVIAAREQIGRFSGPDELTAYTELTPGRVDVLRDLMLFG